METANWSLPPWLIPTETPTDALLKGVQAGSMIAHNRLQAQHLALEAQKLAQFDERNKMEFLLEAQRNAILNKGDMARIQGEMLTNEDKLKTREDWLKAAPTIAKWRDGNLDESLDPSITSGEVLMKSNDIWNKMMMDTTEGIHRTDATKKYNEVMTGQYSTMEDRALMHSYKPFTSQWDSALGITFSGYKEREDAGKLETFQNKLEASTDAKMQVLTEQAEQRGRLQEQKDAAFLERITDAGQRRSAEAALKNLNSNPMFKMLPDVMETERKNLMRQDEYKKLFPEVNTQESIRADLSVTEALLAAKAKEITALRDKLWNIPGRDKDSNEAVKNAKKQYETLEKQALELKSHLDDGGKQAGPAAKSDPLGLFK